MSGKIQLIIIFCFVFIACQNSIDNGSEKHTLADALEAIGKTHDYSDTGWYKATALYHTQASPGVPATLAYYKLASEHYGGKQDYNKATMYADSLLQLVNKPGYETRFYKEKVIANITKADLLYAMKRYKDCYYYYCNGSIEAGKIHDSALTSMLYTRLAMFLYEEGNYSKAIYYYRQLLQDVSGVNKTYNRLIYNQGVQDNMGIAFLKQNKKDSAANYFNAALQSISQAAFINPEEKIFCRTALGVVYGNLAQAYIAAHQYNSAEILFKQSIAINTQPGYANEDALITQQHLAELYYEEKNIPLFYKTLQEIKKGLDTIPNKQVALCWNNLINRYYVIAGQPAKALFYLEQYLHLKDSAKGAKISDGSSSDIFDQMKIMQSNYEVSLLKKDNQMQEGYLLTAAIIILLIIAVTILTFVYLRKSRKNVSVLKILNSKINHKQILLEDTLARLEKENKEKQHILHVVAHDLRNPIAAIHTLATITEDEYEDENMTRENLELIKNACTDSSQLISSILEIAENEEIKYVCQPVDVNVWLSNNMQFLRMKAKDKSQHIRLMTANAKGIIYADVDKMNRVLSNIITNAIKFSASGSSTEIAAIVSEEHITIQVKDNGIGIPEKYHGSIFNAFTEAKRSGTNGEKTFGLGLSITKQIVEKHHGRIWFESEENKGTTFFIELPRYKDVLTSYNTETTLPFKAANHR